MTADFDATIEPALSPCVQALSPSVEAPIAVAVSGGGDSTVLMHQLARWASRLGRQIHVLSVDHGLRPESANEVSVVRAQAVALGLSFTGLRWDTPKGGQAVARQARLKLLSNASRDIGAAVLCLGHTLDDVVETMLMRRRRGVRTSFAAGPDIVSPSPVWPDGKGIAISRPLLKFRRKDIRRWLVEHELNWIDEPSNKDRFFERVRVRQFLNRHPQMQTALQIYASQALIEKARTLVSISNVLSDPHVFVDPDGLIKANLNDLPEDICISALGILIRVAAGGDEPPRRNMLKRAISSLASPGARATLGGGWLQRTKDGFLLGRDPGARSDVDWSGLWDGRYERAEINHLPEFSNILVRDSLPPGGSWREIISARLAFERTLMDLAGRLDLTLSYDTSG